ncbi:MAG: hypothetical protein EOP65_14720 [Sphingomonas sp.]|nr:MAG: hypothetical protein EOP65_14720 [Sphingomonas sp.]
MTLPHRSKARSGRWKGRFARRREDAKTRRREGVARAAGVARSLLDGEREEACGAISSRLRAFA